MAEAPTIDARRDDTAAGRYQVLETERQPFLDIAREMASLTIPSIMPPAGTTGRRQLNIPWQSIGARAVNNLAAKMCLVLFPPGSSFIRLDPDPDTLEEAQKLDETAAQAITDALAKVEKRLMQKMEQKGFRTAAFEALCHEIVCGNVLLYVQPSGKVKLYPLDSYVVKRDLAGNELEIITKESLSRKSLPKSVREFLQSLPEKTAPGDTPPKTIDLYTWIRRQDGGSWKIHQEIEGYVVPGTEGSYPEEKSAWIPLRWRWIPGEDYGRGHCEEHAGDLRSLESLRNSIVMFAAAVSKILFLTDESGVTSKETLARAPSGAFVDGRADDVHVLQVEKMADFSVAKAVYDDTKQAIEQAFLLASAVQRDAERVTAEEIRAMIAELESGLGGIYSLQAEEFQRPVAVRYLHQMQGKKGFPRLPEGAVTPQITTGVEGLGRTSDLQRLDTFIAGVSQQFGPEATAEYVNVGQYMQLRAAALGIDLKGLVRSEQEVQQSRAAAQQQEMMGKLGGPMLGLVGKGADVASKQAAAQSA